MKVEVKQHIFDNFCEKNGYKVIECRSCGFWHVFPAPEAEDLEKYYQELYYQNIDKHGDMKDKNEDPDGYYRMKYSDKYTNLTRLLSEGDEKSILDLGAGFGDFLFFMKEKGWKVCGREPSAFCIEQSRHKDCNISIGGLEGIKSADFGNPSVITLNTVLEHYPYPEELLLDVKDSLMDDRTILHIEVPNDFSFLQESVGAVCNPEKYWVCPPEHLNYWTHESLVAFVTRLGFKVEHIESTFPLELLVLLGDDYISFPEKGRDIHLKRVAFEKKFDDAGNSDIKLQLFQRFAELGFGREVLIYLRKD